MKTGYNSTEIFNKTDYELFKEYDQYIRNSNFSVNVDSTQRKKEIRQRLNHLALAINKRFMDYKNGYDYNPKNIIERVPEALIKGILKRREFLSQGDNSLFKSRKTANQYIKDVIQGLFESIEKALKQNNPIDNIVNPYLCTIYCYNGHSFSKQNIEDKIKCILHTKYPQKGKMWYRQFTSADHFARIMQGYISQENPTIADLALDSMNLLLVYALYYWYQEFLIAIQRKEQFYQKEAADFHINKKKIFFKETRVK